MDTEPGGIELLTKPPVDTGEDSDELDSGDDEEDEDEGDSEDEDENEEEPEDIDAAIASSQKRSLGLEARAQGIINQINSNANNRTTATVARNRTSLNNVLGAIDQELATLDRLARNADDGQQGQITAELEKLLTLQWTVTQALANLGNGDTGSGSGNGTGTGSGSGTGEENEQGSGEQVQDEADAGSEANGNQQVADTGSAGGGGQNATGGSSGGGGGGGGSGGSSGSGSGAGSGPGSVPVVEANIEGVPMDKLLQALPTELRADLAAAGKVTVAELQQILGNPEDPIYQRLLTAIRGLDLRALRGERRDLVAADRGGRGGAVGGVRGGVRGARRDGRGFLAMGNIFGKKSGGKKGKNRGVGRLFRNLGGERKLSGRAVYGRSILGVGSLAAGSSPFRRNYTKEHLGSRKPDRQKKDPFKKEKMSFVPTGGPALSGGRKRNSFGKGGHMR